MGFWLWGWAFAFGVFQELWCDAASGCELGPEISQGADLSFLPLRDREGRPRGAAGACVLCPGTPLRCSSALQSNLPAFPPPACCCSAVPRSPAAPEFAKGVISLLPSLLMPAGRGSLPYQSQQLLLPGIIITPKGKHSTRRVGIFCYCVVVCAVLIYSSKDLLFLFPDLCLEAL